MDSPFIMFAGLLLLLGFFIPAILFLYYQQQTFRLIFTQPRSMNPGQVWLQLVPVFGLVWQFFVISRLSDSIKRQLNSSAGQSFFGEPSTAMTKRPTYSIGIAYATFLCAGVIPLPGVQILFSVAGLVCWIMYWVELSKYNKLLKETLLLSGSTIKENEHQNLPS